LFLISIWVFISGFPSTTEIYVWAFTVLPFPSASTYPQKITQFFAVLPSIHLKNPSPYHESHIFSWEWTNISVSLPSSWPLLIWGLQHLVLSMTVKIHYFYQALHLGKFSSCSHNLLIVPLVNLRLRATGSLILETIWLVKQASILFSQFHCLSHCFPIP
jgi:hypothetical protein